MLLYSHIEVGFGLTVAEAQREIKHSILCSYFVDKVLNWLEDRPDGDMCSLGMRKIRTVGKEKWISYLELISLPNTIEISFNVPDNK